MIFRDDEAKRDLEAEGADEIDFEPEEELGDIAAAQAKLKKLRGELAAVKKERQEYLDGWQRAKADMANARKDAELHGRASAERRMESLFEDLIPVLDSFDMAYGSPAWESVDQAWRSGIDHIRNQLLDVLARNGVERYGKVGEPYSPHLHEAVEERDDMPGEPGTIVRVLRYGYRRGEKLLRPAQVIVKAAAA